MHICCTAGRVSTLIPWVLYLRNRLPFLCSNRLLVRSLNTHPSPPSSGLNVLELRQIDQDQEELLMDDLGCVLWLRPWFLPSDPSPLMNLVQYRLELP